MILDNQIIARENYNKILHSFLTVPESHVFLSNEDIGKYYRYPENYTGAFLKDGTLFVGFNSNLSNEKSKLMSLLRGNVEFIEQRFSLIYLKKMIDILTEKSIHGITSSGIDEEKNCLIIDVKSEQTANQIVSLFNEYKFESASYQIEISNTSIEPNSRCVKPGDLIYRWKDGVRNKNFTATICCDAAINFTNNGFVTCAHTRWSQTDMQLGTADYPCGTDYRFDYVHDAVFVPFSPQIKAVSGIINSSLTNGKQYMLMDLVTNFENSQSLKGETLIGFGGKSETMYGTVEKTNTSYNYAEVPEGFVKNIVDAVELKCSQDTPQKGDSGGIWTRVISQSGDVTLLSAVCMHCGRKFVEAGNYYLGYGVQLIKIYYGLQLTNFYGGSDKDI